MKINILNIKNTYGNECNLTEDIDMASENTFEYTFPETVKADYHLRIIGSTVLFKCEFSVNMNFICTRCLEEFKKVIFGEFEALYLNKKEYRLYQESEENESVYSENEISKEQLENDTIDTYSIVRENVLLAIPYVNRCSDNCKIIGVV